MFFCKQRIVKKKKYLECLSERGMLFVYYAERVANAFTIAADATPNFLVTEEVRQTTMRGSLA